VSETSTLTANQSQSTDTAERREDERIPYRSLVTSFEVDPETGALTPQSLPAWSTDVSKSGAGIVTSQPLPSENLFLRFLLPWAGTQCLECSIANSEKIDSFMGEPGPFYRYGVSFVRLVSEEELEEAVREAQSA